MSTKLGSGRRGQGVTSKWLNFGVDPIPDVDIRYRITFPVSLTLRDRAFHDMPSR